MTNYTDRIAGARERAPRTWTPDEVKAVAVASYRLGYADGWDDSIPGLPYPLEPRADIEAEADHLMTRLPPD